MDVLLVQLALPNFLGLLLGELLLFFPCLEVEHCTLNLPVLHPLKVLLVRHKLQLGVQFFLVQLLPNPLLNQIFRVLLHGEFILPLKDGRPLVVDELSILDGQVPLVGGDIAHDRGDSLVSLMVIIVARYIIRSSHIISCIYINVVLL
jgi:hypothetical protein